MPNERQETLRVESGEVDSDDPLVMFLYDLMTSELPAGVVAGLLDGQLRLKVHFTNGYMARYATHLAKLLRLDTEPERIVKPTSCYGCPAYQASPGCCDAWGDSESRGITQAELDGPPPDWCPVRGRGLLIRVDP